MERDIAEDPLGVGCTLILFHQPSLPQVWKFWVTWGVEMMPLCHVWGSHPPQTTSYIHVRYMQSVWALGILSQGYTMVAPLSHSTGQVDPRFGNYGSLVIEYWGTEMMPLCHVETDINLRLLQTSILDIQSVSNWLPSTSNRLRHPCKMYAKWLAHWNAVSTRAFGCTLIPFHQPSWPPIWEFWVTLGAEMMPFGDVWGLHPPQTTS